MWPPTRFLWLLIHLDTNRINARGSLPNISELEKLAADGLIHLELSEPAQREALHGNSHLRRRKAFQYMATETLATTDAERCVLKKIEAILCPLGAPMQGQRADIEIVFNAWKYADILVTNDGASKRQPGGILGNAERLAELGIKVMSDQGAVAYVRNLIAARDRHAQELAAIMGEPVPEWVGRD